jgi:NADPH:quinone reductase-like Zn-dependent oxidoreductase
MKSGVVPGSDGAGTVIAIGRCVTRFKKGDNVCTTLNQGHIGGSLTPVTFQTSLGGSLDGTLRQYGVFPESGLVLMPETLTFREASTLPCAAVTAWNILYGLPGKSLKPGDTVLTLGTGGVSLFAVQLAIAAGAMVISTTSSAEKAARLKALGARHVINYREDNQWGETAKSLTPRCEGVDFVVEIGGATTLSQSMAAIKIDGLVAIAGSIGSAIDAAGDPGLLSAWANTCLVRGIAVGSRAQFEEMNQAFVTNGIKPLVENTVFKLDQLKEACQYMWDQKNFGKVVVDCQ